MGGSSNLAINSFEINNILSFYYLGLNILLYFRPYIWELDHVEATVDFDEYSITLVKDQVYSLSKEISEISAGEFLETYALDKSGCF